MRMERLLRSTKDVLMYLGSGEPARTPVRQPMQEPGLYRASVSVTPRRCAGDFYQHGVIDVGPEVLFDGIGVDAVAVSGELKAVGDALR